MRLRENIIHFKKIESEEDFKKSLLSRKLKVIERHASSTYTLEFPNEKQYHFYYGHDIREKILQNIFTIYLNENQFEEIKSYLDKYKIPFSTWKVKDDEFYISISNDPDYIDWKILEIDELLNVLRSHGLESK